MIINSLFQQITAIYNSRIVFVKYYSMRALKKNFSSSSNRIIEFQSSIIDRHLQKHICIVYPQSILKDSIHEKEDVVEN